ncbi:hypothetical protein [Texcoconibacillus texcoconensis]|uniref:CRISPR-associated protein Csh1 n=1 Tax=Texcoconibacillus texcoconensis TaxID=1095777 RepID=A0A840QST1_9BACI|nr:hypothetical protein [Texcoconibacillus texcoconensis]MBB5174424.1 hypothetical protein [Texcoconibacillus texcoconensis]
MLLDAIIRVGRPIVHSSLSNEKRIKYLTDIENDTCKNFFENVFIVEVSEMGETSQMINLQDHSDNNGNPVVNHDRTSAFPFFMPSGGNPLNAQGLYPAPCYLMYDRHIKEFSDKEKTTSMILARLKRTISLKNWEDQLLEEIAEKVSEELFSKSNHYINSDDKQLGVLYIIDYRLSMFDVSNHHSLGEPWLFINKSVADNNQSIIVNSEEIIEHTIESRFQEAQELGVAENSVSTLSNQKVEKTVSAYNKTWLWLSPTWESPRSIYWKDDEWVKGIRLSRDEYESYVYGTQFIKRIQTNLSSALLKEMFAPITNAEAKRHMKTTSFDSIYAIPFVLPLLEKDSQQQIEIYDKLLRPRDPQEKEKKPGSDLQLEMLGGLRGRILPKMSDEHRLMILYYSGDLGKGNVHIRSVIEDVIPSIATKLQKIMKGLQGTEKKLLIQDFQLPENKIEIRRMDYLPSLISNAYGPGYVWQKMNDVFHRKTLTLRPLQKVIAYKLNELANKGNLWQMKEELIFYHGFRYFYRRYNSELLKIEKEVDSMESWRNMLERYQEGALTDEDFKETSHVAFISGLALRQFSNSYYQKTGKNYVEHRVMKFGSKLTPEMIWKQGLLRTEEVYRQWDLGLANNYHKALQVLLIRLLELDKSGKLRKEKDAFITAFWSGYLMYEKKKGEDENDSE